MRTAGLDDVDDRILRELIRNGRATYAQLGSVAGLSPHAAAERVRRLQRSGVIEGFTARVRPDAMGRRVEAYLDVRLMPGTRSDQFEARLAALAGVVEIAFVTGRSDYHVRVACRDAEELDRTVRAIRRDRGAAATETRLVLHTQSVDAA